MNHCTLVFSLRRIGMHIHLYVVGRKWSSLGFHVTMSQEAVYVKWLHLEKCINTYQKETTQKCRLTASQNNPPEPGAFNL